MAEKPTFCPRCLKMHTGICTAPNFKSTIREAPKAAEPEPRQTLDPGSSSGRTADFESADAGSIPAPGAKFDKKAYQRELMRKRRAAAKTPPRPFELD